jgi:hypothetical protein
VGEVLRIATQRSAGAGAHIGLARRGRVGYALPAYKVICRHVVLSNLAGRPYGGSQTGRRCAA